MPKVILKKYPKVYNTSAKYSKFNKNENKACISINMNQFQF